MVSAMNKITSSSGNLPLMSIRSMIAIRLNEIVTLTAIAMILVRALPLSQPSSAISRALDPRAPPCAVYSAGAGTSGLAAALADAGLRPVVIGHELTDETRPLLQSGVLDALIVQDPGHEARSAVRILMAALTGTALNENQERIRIEVLFPDNLPGAELPRSSS